MRRSWLLRGIPADDTFRNRYALVTLLGLLVGCSSAPQPTSVATSDAGPSESGTPAKDAGSSGPPTGDAGGDAANAVDAPVGPAPDGSVTNPATIAMPHISDGAPAFASSSANYQTVASAANDEDPLTAWSPSSLPAWIAYDLSTVPASQRQSALVVWNALHSGSYINASTPSGADMPTDYVIEVNAAPTGSAPPTSGWSQVAAVASNLRGTVETPIAMGAANWIRMTVTGSTDPTLAIDLDVFSTPYGATDSWLFMGDSITYITMPYAWNDLPKLVHTARPDRWPAVINAAIGGTNTSTAVSVIDDTMSGFPGRYVVLAYGTNDNVSQGGNFEMETLVQHVLQAGKIPVIPHMPWSDIAHIQTNGPMINQAIDALYAKYPQILPGPDLWTAFMNRTDLIPSGDVHPNSAGQEFLRQQWATVMAAVP
jgi:hypothetical protein